MDQKRKLYVSFSNLLYQMADGRIVPEDLEGALFYFGCARKHLDKNVHDNVDVEFAFDLGPNSCRADFEGAIKAYESIKEAVFKAEKEGRAAFRKINKPNSFKELNELLERNGIDISPVQNLSSLDPYLNIMPLYCHPTVRQYYGDLVEVMTR